MACGRKEGRRKSHATAVRVSGLLLAQSGGAFMRGRASRGLLRADGRGEAVCGGLGRRCRTVRPTSGSGRHFGLGATKATESAAAGATASAGLGCKRLAAQPRRGGRPIGLPKQGLAGGAQTPSGSSSLAGHGLRGGRCQRMEGSAGSDSTAFTGVAAPNFSTACLTSEARWGQASIASAGRVTDAVSPKTPTRRTPLLLAAAAARYDSLVMSQGRESRGGRWAETTAPAGSASGAARKIASRSPSDGKAPGPAATGRC